jgi:diguanylate cyclase (GGDEF)-like protein
MQDVSTHSHGLRWARLTAAVASFATRPALGGFAAGEPAQRRARMLAALLTTLILLAVIALIVVVVVDPAGSSRRGEYGVLITGTLLLLAGAFALNRAGLYKAAAALTVACAVVAPWCAALLDPRVVRGDFVPLTYVVVPVLLSGILLSAGFTAIVSIAQIAGLLVFATTAENAAPINWPSLCTMVLFVSALSIVASRMDGKDLEQIVRQNAQLEESEALLREQSVRDHVSGLFNRRYLEETLERELHRAARNETSLGIVMMDIDRFKELNDRFGHAAGDEVLRGLGVLLKSSLRFADIACRYGGDEFTLILPDAPKQVVQERAEQVRGDVAALEVRFLGRPLPALTLSIGVAVFPDDGANAAALLAASDVALYRAKQGGRDRVEMVPAGGGRPVVEHG